MFSKIPDKMSLLPFLRATAYNAIARLYYCRGVHLPVCPSHCRTVSKRRNWGSWNLHCVIDQSLVSNEVTLVPLVEEIPLELGHQGGVPPIRNCYFTTIGSSSVKTVADRHRLAAHHNKHCWRVFQWYQHRWPWTTLNPKIRVFSEFFSNFRLQYTF